MSLYEEQLRQNIQATRPKAIPRPSVAARSAAVAKNVGSKVAGALTRPIAARAGGMAVAKGVGRFAVRAAGPLGLAATGAAVAGNAVKDTETAQAIQRPIVNAATSAMGVDDLQNRMLSEDPTVSSAAVAEYGTANPNIQRPNTAPGIAPAAAAAQEQPATTLARPNPEAAVDAYTTANAAPSSSQVNAANPAPIPNSEYGYAGQQGETQTLVRPTIGADGRPIMNPNTGKAVPEFSDANTAFNRPVSPQSYEAQAAEAAKVAQARADYTANTTGSDGRRHFGGAESEALANAQIASSEQGKNLDVITQQLSDQGLTPEQRAAYKADPAGSYNVDADANTATATAQLAAFKQQYDMNRNAKTDVRLNRTAAMKEAGDALAPLKTTAPEAYSQLLAMSGEQFDPASGESMSQVVQRLLSSLELDGGIPQLDESGRLVQKQQTAATGAQQQVDTFF